MTLDLIFTVIGYLGTLLISASYVLALGNYATRQPKLFLWLNLLGGISLCFPTYLANTLVTHVLNGFWIFIALSGLLALYSNERFKVRMRTTLMVAAGSILLVLYLGIPALREVSGHEWWVRLLGMLAMLAFMLGYFVITQMGQEGWALPAYLLLSMSGNVLYAPLLIADQNIPILSLQGFCFVAGLIKLMLMVGQATNRRALQTEGA